MKLLIFLTLFCYTVGYGQTLNNKDVETSKVYEESKRKIAITIDDVPNTRNYISNGFRSKLLAKLDSLNLPVTIFLNEGRIYRTDSTSKNLGLYEDWIKRNYTTIGNHTFSHSRYSEVGLEQFIIDIEKEKNYSKKLPLNIKNQ